MHHHPRPIRLLAAFLSAALAGALVAPAQAQSVADFYRGKNLTLAIGYTVGGGYDLYARLLARHLGKHVPGNPTIVPQNREGAGSLRATMFLYTAAPKDGTMIGTFSRSMAVAPLVTDTAHFDGTKFNWLGSVTNDVSLCVSWHTSAIKTWDDFLTKPSTFGGQAAGSDPDIFALLFKNVFGAKLKLVTGYPGTNEISLAMERGEVDGFCGLSWSSITSRHPEWLKGNKINLLVQAALAKEPDLPNVPLITDLTKDPEKLQMINLIIASQAMARPFAAPPGIPDDRKKALRDAFDATMKDPEFLAEAERLKVDINPIGGEAIDKMLAEIYRTPKDVLAKAAKAIAE
jgi:tripartite-type tricarboxylate transporter receptor subunit TctC